MKKIPLMSLCCLLGLACAHQPVNKPSVSQPPSVKPAPAPVWVSPVGLNGALFLPATNPTPDQLKNGCEQAIEQADELRQQLVDMKGDHSFAPLDLMNQIDVVLDRVAPAAGLLANVHPEKAVRDAAEACQRAVSEFTTALSLDRAVFDVLSKVDPSLGDGPARRSLKRVLDGYRRSGVDKSEKVRARITVIEKEMVDLSLAFGRNIREDVKKLTVSPKRLAGLPTDFIADRKGTDGQVTITTDYPDFFPVEKYAEDASLRKELYQLFLSRAFPANEQVLHKLLALRLELATLLGYGSYADFAAELQMAKNSANIASFIDRIAHIARPRMERDLEALLALKKEDDKNAHRVEVYDRFYYVEKLKAETLGLDMSKVRNYFPFQQVIDGVLGFNQRFFGVTFEQVVDAPVWAEGVVQYRVLDGKTEVGRFYLDMHPRAGKYKHAAMFHVVTGVSGVQLPVAALVCNFPASTKENPGLMEHDDVVTLFHEFGHLMHHILGGGQSWLNISGISCESEFVEAPSQFLEEFAYDARVLAPFAKDAQTGEPIPAELVTQLNKARGLGKGVHVMRQLFYAGLSLNLHLDQVPDNLDEVVSKVAERYSPYRLLPDTHVVDSFGHIVGYSSEYYSYMWSLSLAKDLYTRFKVAAPFDSTVLGDYRSRIISQGGAVDAAQMVADFLGRETNFEAMARYLEE